MTWTSLPTIASWYTTTARVASRFLYPDDLSQALEYSRCGPYFQATWVRPDRSVLQILDCLRRLDQPCCEEENQTLSHARPPHLHLLRESNDLAASDLRIL